MSASIVASIGHHGFWGYSTAFDWFRVLSDSVPTSEEDQPLLILLVNPGDIRHILMTVSQRRRSKNTKRPIHFYLLDSPIEVLAREILLLEVVNDYEVPIRQRANIFLEIFGNVKVQDRTCRYIEQLGFQLRSLIADGTGRLDGIVDLSKLKYRERDELESVFKSYARSYVFDMDNLRDHRCRGYYGDRFDSRKAVADWDYHATIKSTASIIHVRQFKEWRLSGIAYEFGDQVYSEPNRTLMSFTEGTMKHGKEKGMKKEVKGFWGDIVASPYYAFGVFTETPNKFAEDLFDILNKNTGTEQHRHHAVEVAVYTLLSMLWEIETGSVYLMTKAHEIYSGLGSEAAPGAEEDQAVDVLDLITEGDDEDGVKNDGKENSAFEISGEEVQKEKGASETHSCSAESSGVESGLPAAATVGAQVQASDGSKASISPPPAPQSSDDTGEKKLKDEQAEEAEMVKALQRAECIVENWQDVKVFPLLGTPATAMDKPRYQGIFHGAFVSSRSAHLMGSGPENGGLDGLLRPGAIIGCETGKFLVPLQMHQKKEFDGKAAELAARAGWVQIAAPVPRQRRDELDTMDDVIFFQKPF